jgi:tetratricopeptide (TPR) repeat protein
MLVAVLLFSLCTGLTYICVHRHSVNSELDRLYREGLRPVRTAANPFCPEAQIAHYDSILAVQHGSGAAMVQCMKAYSLLELGQEKQAIDLLQKIHQPASAGTEPDLVKDQIQSLLGLAYLRLGERNNCIQAHCAGSCVFPIRNDGVYSDPYASQKAIDLYEQFLRDRPNDLTTRWLLNIAYMTLGLYPAKVPAQWLIPNLDKDTCSSPVKPFTDMAGSLGLNSGRNMAGGVIVDDFDHDGYLDIVTSCWDLVGGSMHYYHNNGDGTFTDRSRESGLSEIKGGLNIIQADYNNDGNPDILVIRGAWLQEMGRQPKTLLRNNGDGTFTDVTVESGILSFSPTQAAVWADFNNDGWLDLFIGNETSSGYSPPHPAELYINNHDGTFTNMAEEAGVDKIAFTKGVASADYDNDGWPDIFLSNLDGNKMLLHNKGIKGRIPQFEDATARAGLNKDHAQTFPTWFFDYDNDGWPDIFIAGYSFKGHLAAKAASDALQLPEDHSADMHLYHNNHDGTFTDVTAAVGLDKTVYAMGANFGDIDNDGWLDMYLGTGNPDYTSLIPNRMFRNIGGTRFEDVTNSARVGNLQKGHGVSFADIDNDGDQDIFIETGGAYPGDAYYNSLYVNPGQNDNAWISVLLEGVHSNRSAIGAHIAVTFTEDGKQRTVYRDVGSGGSFGAKPLRQEIGIGKATVIDELIIKWPTSGTVQVFKNVKPRRFLHIREGDDHFDEMPLKTFQLKDQMKSMKMVSCAPPH